MFAASRQIPIYTGLIKPFVYKCVIREWRLEGTLHYPSIYPDRHYLPLDTDRCNGYLDWQVSGRFSSSCAKTCFVVWTGSRYIEGEERERRCCAITGITNVGTSVCAAALLSSGVQYSTSTTLKTIEPKRRSDKYYLKSSRLGKVESSLARDRLEGAGCILEWRYNVASISTRTRDKTVV